MTHRICITDFQLFPIVTIILNNFQMKQFGIHVVTVAVGAMGAYCIREYFGGGVCKNTTRLDNKTVIITGCNR